MAARQAGQLSMCVEGKLLPSYNFIDFIGLLRMRYLLAVFISDFLQTVLAHPGMSLPSNVGGVVPSIRRLLSPNTTSCDTRT